MKRFLTQLLVAAVIAAGASTLRPAPLQAADPAQAFARVPPEVALLTVALGGLNGLVVDYLWLRLAEQQEQGRYFEMLQTADWISALQPQRGALYGFQAWNLAYNVSLEFSEPADRWRWILGGLRLLLDRGLTWNREDPLIYTEIAQILQDKVTARLDTAQFEYKRLWAEEWHRLLGAGRPDWAALERAPTAEAVLAEEPVKRFLAAAAEAGVPDVLTLLERDEAPAADSPAAKLLAQPEHAAAIARVRAPIRDFKVREFWRLEPARMAAVDREWGPFDWRTGPPHVVYWTLLGIDAAGGPGRDRRLERMLYQALVSAFEQGPIMFVPGGEPLAAAYDIRLIPRVEKAYRRAIGLFPDDPSMRQSRGIFQRNATVALAAAGRRSEARRRFAALRDEFPDEPDFRLPFDAFVNGELADLAAGGPTEVAGVVQSILTQSFALLAAGETKQAEMLAGLARLVHAQYRAEAPDDATFPTFEALRRAALAACWSGTVPEPLRGGLPALDGAR